MNKELIESAMLSMRIALLATALASLVAVPLAYFNARRKYWGRSIAEALIIVPMVLPPTVVGYILIESLGRRSWIGKWLFGRFDYTFLFTMESAIIAATLVALPLIYLPTRAAFSSIDRDMEDNARTMGAGKWQIFYLISLPIALRGTVSGILLGFARALGEFGATAMVFGLRDDRTSTLPVSIYLHYEHSDAPAARPAVAMLLAISLAITFFYNRSWLGRQER